MLDLFDALREGLARYLTSFALTVPDAEEIIQETFLALFPAPAARWLTRRDNLRGWLFRVAHNAGSQEALPRSPGLPESPRTAVSVEDLVRDPGPNPEDQFAALQMHERLMAVVEALPEQDRQCLILRAEGLRYREIAEVLDIARSVPVSPVSLGGDLWRGSGAQPNGEE